MRRIPLAEIKVQETSINSNIIQNSRIEPKIYSNQGFSFSKQISQENNITHRVITPKEFHGYPLDAIKQANTIHFRVESPSIKLAYSSDKQSNNHESDDNDIALKSIKKASILNKMKHKSKFNAFIRRQSGIPVKNDLNADQPKVKLTLLYHVTPQKLLSNIFEKKHQSLKKFDKKTPEKTERNIKIEQVISCNLSKKEETEYITQNIFSSNEFSDSDNNNTQHQIEKNVVLINSLNPNITSITMKGIKINFNQNIEFPSLKKANYRNLSENVIKFVI